jgi:hypothetical protein
MESSDRMFVCLPSLALAFYMTSVFTLVSGVIVSRNPGFSLIHRPAWAWGCFQMIVASFGFMHQEQISLVTQRRE